MSSDYQGPAYNKKILQSRKKRRFNQGMDSRTNLDWQLEEPAFTRKKRQGEQKKPAPAWIGEREVFEKPSKKEISSRSLESLTSEKIAGETDLEKASESSAGTYQVPFLQNQLPSTSPSGKGPNNSESYSILNGNYLTKRLNQRSGLDAKRYSEAEYKPSLNTQIETNKRTHPVKDTVSGSLRNIEHSLDTLNRMQTQYESHQVKGRLNRELLLRLVKRKDSFLLFD